jgi:hypothetical protein
MCFYPAANFCSHFSRASYTKGNSTTDLRKHAQLSCLMHINSFCRASRRPSSSLVSVSRDSLRPPVSKAPFALSQVTTMTIALLVRLQSLIRMSSHGATKRISINVPTVSIFVEQPEWSGHLSSSACKYTTDEAQDEVEKIAKKRTALESALVRRARAAHGRPSRSVNLPTTPTPTTH